MLLLPEVELCEVDAHGDHVVPWLLQHVLQVHLHHTDFGNILLKIN